MTTTSTNRQTSCPTCLKKGKRVSPVTIRALLKDAFLPEVDVAASESCCVETETASGCSNVSKDTGWRFCDAPECDVAYFSESAGRTFKKSQLRVQVGVKETTGERPLCYCFGYSVEKLKEEIRTSGDTSALAEIRSKMKDPGCRCETENPSGSCCLGSVAKGIKTSKQELGVK